MMKKNIFKKNAINLFSILLGLILVLSSVSCKQAKDAKTDNSSDKAETGQVEKNKIPKLYEGKDIIYDANYLDELEPYTATDFEYDQEDELIEKQVEVSFAQCKIPYININSNGAKKINEHILEYTKEYIVRDYQHGKEESIAYEPLAYYKYELTDDYISILFEYDIGMFERPDNVRTYILDLETGEELSLDKAIRISGINEDLLGIVEGKIVEFYDDMLKDFQEFHEDAYFMSYQSDTLYNFWQEYYGGKLNFYLTTEKELSLLVNFEVPMGGGIFQERLHVRPNDLPIKQEINPIYEYLAKEDYNSYEGGVAFLGYHSFDNMRTITSKVETIISKFGDQGKLPLFYFYHELDDGSYVINGDEFYLLAAKYKNSIIKIYKSVNDQSGEVVFDSQSLNIYGSNCISICNLSDIRPNTKVEFIYRDKTIEFSPSVSLMDSSYINEIDGILDLGDAYRELEETQVNLESSSSLPYMWRRFKIEEFVD